MKIVLAVIGVGSSGKTSTLLLLEPLIRTLFPTATCSRTRWAGRRRDVSLRIRIDDKTVAIESRGDPASDLLKRLDDCARAKCDVIVCATRARGSTVDAVARLSKQGYAIKQFPKTRVRGTAAQLKSDRTLALVLLDEVRSLIDV